MTVTHELKCKQQWYTRTRLRQKTVEIRKHDRDFQVGDLIKLVRVNEYGYAVHNAPTSLWEITHVLPHEAFPDGLQPGYCALSIKPYRELAKKARTKTPTQEDTQ